MFVGTTPGVNTTVTRPDEASVAEAAPEMVITAGRGSQSAATGESGLRQATSGSSVPVVTLLVDGVLDEVWW